MNLCKSVALVFTDVSLTQHTHLTHQPSASAFTIYIILWITKLIVLHTQNLVKSLSTARSSLHTLILGEADELKDPLLSSLHTEPYRLSMDFSDQDDLERARFATVLRNLKRDNIASFASLVRYSGHPSTGLIDVPATPRPVGCRLLSNITCGSYNAVFRVLFADGTLWVLKVPANGHHECWDAPAREALTSEAFTMRLIRRETSIPVPEVFAFDASYENELGCPFILMELIHGKLLQDVWFDQGVSQAMREQVRIRSLQGIAEAMTQLNSLAFNQGGSLLFDSKGNVVGIGSSNIVDLETQYANMRSTDYDNTMAFCQTGPFEDAKSYLLSSLETREGKHERCEVEQGAYKLLRLLIEWSIEDATVEEKPFVLAHPDLDKQNILVNDDGSLAGIIDWDWIAAVPRCVGCQSLPKFLTQDYDPARYGYDVEAGAPIQGHLADSPAELTCYRAIYAQFMESYLSKEDRLNLTKSRRHAAQVLKLRKQAAEMTRRSLIITSLHHAATVPSEMKKLMTYIFDQIEDITAAEWPEESSTADSGNFGDSEEAEDKDADNETSEVDNSDIVREESCIHSVECEKKADNIGHLSIDALMDEIEKLTDMSSTSTSKRDLEQGPAELDETSTAEPKMADIGVEAHRPETVEPTKGAHKARAARACGWFKEKLARGAKCLHKKPEKGDENASAGTNPGSRPRRTVRNVFGWTEKKLRRVASCLHCDSDDEDEAKTESQIESICNGGIDALQSLQDKLRHLREKLHREGNQSSEVSDVSEEEASQNQQAICVPKELSRAEKRSVCDRFVQMVKGNNLCLTADQQVAVAQWVIKTLQDPSFSETELDTACSHPHGTAESHPNDAHSGDDDSEIKTQCEEDREGGNQNGTGGSEGKEGTDEIGHRDDDEDELIEKPQAAVGPKAEGPTQEDLGDFYLMDVCIALAKDNLDERRMQRLRSGFFGLLKQTM